jgi:hypothetical protein
MPHEIYLVGINTRGGYAGVDGHVFDRGIGA